MAQSISLGNKTSRFEWMQARLDWIESILREMDSDAAVALRLRLFQGWTLRQIGQQLCLSPSAVDGRIHRLVRKLRAKAEADDLEP